MSIHTAPARKIVLNMEEHHLQEDSVDYARLANLAYPQDPPALNSDIVYTITVSHPQIGDRSLARDDRPIELHEGMVCHVRKTGRS